MGSDWQSEAITWSGWRPGEAVTFVDSGVFPALLEELDDGSYYVRAHAFGSWLYVTPDGHVHPEPLRYWSRADAEAAVRARLELVQRLRSENLFVQQ